MDDWPVYERFGTANGVVMDQNTQNSVLLSSRIGYQVARYSLRELMDWTPVDEVQPSASPDQLSARAGIPIQ